MKNKESLSLKEYKEKRKSEVSECKYAVIAAVLMMIPVVSFMYGAIVTYDDDNSASRFIMILFLSIGLVMAGIILRLVYKQFVKSREVIAVAREEFFESGDESEITAYKKKKRSIRICSISSVCLTFAILITIGCVSTARINSIYRQAETLITQEKYEDALALLETIEKNHHKDTLSLIVLCESYIDYNRGYGVDAYYAMQKVYFHWQDDEQETKIAEFKKALENEYDEHIERMVENSKKSYESKKSTESNQKKTKSKSTYVPKYKEDKSDPYNAKDYRNEEDFYDDHYDDFFDYYDAEAYYRKHHD